MKPLFKTADSILAATIISSLGSPFIGIDKSNPKKRKFVFPSDSVPEDFVSAFKQGNVRVDPLMFCLAQKLLQQKIERA